MAITGLLLFTEHSLCPEQRPKYFAETVASNLHKRPMNFYTHFTNEEKYA